jgi:hypothetical protein
MKIKGLTIISLFCFGIIIWINFISFKFNELIFGTAEKTEFLVETICLSFIAAYIFYYLNVYLVEKRERKTILPFISKNVISIIVNNHSIIKCLKKDQKISLDFHPNKEEFKELLSKINPNDKSPYYYQNENWLFLLKNRQESTLDLINRIFLSGKYVDEKLRKILLEMQYSLYLKHNYAFNSSDFNDSNFEKYNVVFLNYFKLIKELNEYYEKHLKEYYLMTLPKRLRKK